MGDIIMSQKVFVISAVWCPSCLILKKHLKRLMNDYNINIEILDYDFDEEIVKKYNVGDTLPVIICGSKRLIGEKNYEEIVEFLESCDVI